MANSNATLRIFFVKVMRHSMMCQRSLPLPLLYLRVCLACPCFAYVFAVLAPALPTCCLLAPACLRLLSGLIKEERLGPRGGGLHPPNPSAIALYGSSANHDANDYANDYANPAVLFVGVWSLC